MFRDAVCSTRELLHQRRVVRLSAELAIEVFDQETGGAAGNIDDLADQIGVNSLHKVV